MLKGIYNFSAKTYEIINKAEEAVKEKFAEIERVCLYNQAKVMKAFSEKHIGAAHLNGTTGYGYDDMGRDALDRVYADVFEAEDALVRYTMISGTHAISTALFAVLRPGDTLLAVTGKPYDTFDGVIGLDGNENGSLINFGVKYEQVDLIDGHADIPSIKAFLSKEKVKMVHIQRSRGYEWNHDIGLSEIRNIIEAVKSVSTETI